MHPPIARLAERGSPRQSAYESLLFLVAAKPITVVLQKSPFGDWSLMLLVYFTL